MAAERDGVEAALEAKVAAWQTALDAYRAARAVDGSANDHDAVSGASKPAAAAFDLPVGALRRQSVPEAIKLVLAAGRRKQANKDIASSLLAGGLETGAKNLEASVAAALHRLKKAGVVLRFSDGWDLAEHYPDHIRRKLELASSTKRPAKAKRRAQSAKRTQTEQPGRQEEN